MKRTPLKRKTPMDRRSAPLRRTGFGTRGDVKSRPKRKPISPASPKQRAKIAEEVSIVSGREGCDPAHLWARGAGGCDHPDCVVPLTREEHRAYDDGKLDILPFLIRDGRIPELQHALEHANGSLTRLLHRVTGERHWPESEIERRAKAEG